MTIQQNHITDSKGNPAGGVTEGTGFRIQWQNGPLVMQDGYRIPPNGAFVEEVIEAAIGRLEFYQNTKFACWENQDALDHLRVALEALQQRTRKREAQGVEGTHQIHEG